MEKLLERRRYNITLLDWALSHGAMLLSNGKHENTVNKSASLCTFDYAYYKPCCQPNYNRRHSDSYNSTFEHTHLQHIITVLYKLTYTLKDNEFVISECKIIISFSEKIYNPQCSQR